MEWINKLNQSISYIEDNLDGDVNYEEAAKIACCSTFYYQRMFSYMAGVTLSEYIRRRRMTKAAFELQNSDIKILDLSAKYSYNSPTSFNRAFQSIHNTTPSAARKKGITLKTYPKLIFSLSVKGNAEMKYRIENKPAIHIVGTREKFVMDLEKNFITVPEFWKKTMNSELFPHICELMNQAPHGILGVTEYYQPNEIYHYIAVATDKEVPEGMIEHEIPATTWAIFECTGTLPESMQELYRRFYTEWMPFSGYAYAEEHDIEVYPMLNEQSQKSEVWFSIKLNSKINY